MVYKYQPKVTPTITAEDVMRQREAVMVIKYKMQELKRDTTRKLKQMRRELLAVQAWVKRHDSVSGAAGRESPFTDALSTSERDELDKACKNVFG
jgi:hypothetical protein